MSLSSVAKCYPCHKEKGFGLYFLTEISTPQVCPLFFIPAPCDDRVDCDDVLEGNPYSQNNRHTVTYRHAGGLTSVNLIHRPA